MTTQGTCSCSSSSCRRSSPPSSTTTPWRWRAESWLAFSSALLYFPCFFCLFFLPIQPGVSGFCRPPPQVLASVVRRRRGVFAFVAVVGHCSLLNKRLHRLREEMSKKPFSPFQALDQKRKEEEEAMRRRMEARLRGQSAEEPPSQAEQADHDRRRQPSPPRSISPRAPSPSFPPPAAEPKVEGSIAPGMAKQGPLFPPSGRHFLRSNGSPIWISVLPALWWWL